MEPPLKNYGFTHLFEGRQFSFAVAADSEERAKGLVGSMARSELVGVLLEDKVEPARVTDDTVNAVTVGV